MTVPRPEATSTRVPVAPVGTHGEGCARAALPVATVVRSRIPATSLRMSIGPPRGEDGGGHHARPGCPRRRCDVTVVHLTIGPREARPAPADRKSLPHLFQLIDPGYVSGDLYDRTGRYTRVEQSPTVFVVRKDGIVSAIFEGPNAWDMAAVERAARNQD